MNPCKTIDPLRNFGFLLKDVSRLYSRNFERQSAALGLTLAQCNVLSHRQRNEGISQVRLADISDTDPMTLGRLLDRMVADGLIERSTDPGDRRARRLFLQAGALPVIDEIRRLPDNARAQSLAGLNAADRAQPMRPMQHLHAKLDALMSGAADSHAARPASKNLRLHTQAA